MSLESRVLPLLHEYIRLAYKKAFKAIDAEDEAIVFKTIELAPIAIIRSVASKHRDEESSSDDDSSSDEEPSKTIKTKGKIGSWFRFKTSKDELEFKRLVISEIKAYWRELHLRLRESEQLHLRLRESEQLQLRLRESEHEHSKIEINAIQYQQYLKSEFNEYFIWSYDELERYGIIDELEEYTSRGFTLDESIEKLKFAYTDFDDELTSFFTYITASGGLPHFSEQFYWMKNAYSMLVYPQFKRLIDKYREHIAAELKV